MPVAYFKDSKGRSAAKRNESAALQRTEGETKDRIPPSAPLDFENLMQPLLYRVKLFNEDLW